MQTKMAQNLRAWRSGKARNLVPRACVPLDKGNEEGSGHEIVNGAKARYNSLCSWLKANTLSLNIAKTEFMVISTPIRKPANSLLAR